MEALEARLEALREGADEEAADDEAYEDDAQDSGEEAPTPRFRPRRAVSGWKTFIDSGAGKANLSASSLLVLLAIAWPMTAPRREPAQRPPVVSSAGPRSAGESPPKASTANPGEGQGEKTPVAATEKPATPVAVPKAASAGEAALDSQLVSIVKEYRSGLIDAKRAIAALEDYKRLHPDSAASQSADNYLNQIRDNAVEVGKTALSRFLKGDLPKLVEQSEYREAVSRLTKIGTAHPLILKDVNDETAKVEGLAAAAFKSAGEKADRAVAEGDFARAKEILSAGQGTLPEKIAVKAKEKLKTLERDEKEFAELAGPLSVQIEAMRDAILSLDFEKAAALATALPKAASPALIRRRQDAAAEAALTKAAFALVSDAARKAGKSTDPSVLFTQSAKDLAQLLGAQPTKGDLEGLGLLVLHFAGPERARDLLLDARLGAAKTESYKALLIIEEEEHLARLARSFGAKVESLKKSGKATKKDWETLAASLLDRIRVSRSQKGYLGAKAELANAFLKAKAEVLRGDVPQSLFNGKVKSYKPDGSIELSYEFNSEDELKDFVPVRSTASRLELEEKMAKLRGECRLGRGDVFRNRLGVSGKLPGTSGFSSQSPNLNVALWTRDDDRVSWQQKRGAAGDGDPDDSTKVEGTPDDYFVFAIGYRTRLPVTSSTDGLVVRGSGAVVSMPANVILGGLRGEPLHRASQGDCLWGKPLVKISGAQTFRVLMAQGVVTWSSSSQTLANAKELRDAQLLKRDDPYIGSVTFFTNGDVLLYDSITVEGDLNPAWVEEQLVAAAEVELKKVEPN